MQLKLIDSLVSQLKFSKTTTAELAWVDAQVSAGYVIAFDIPFGRKMHPALQLQSRLLSTAVDCDMIGSY